MSISASRPVLPGSANGPVLRFVFIADGAEVPAEALSEFADPVRLPAMFVPHAAGGSTQAEPGRGWSETPAGQPDTADLAPAFDVAAVTKNPIFDSAEAQRRPAAYGWAAGASAAPVSTSGARRTAPDGATGARSPAVIPVIDPHA